ncbi:hypothetical protein ASE14_18475 [Agromyces sp. Root81]|uniref:LacI family DNA-binding transcriptional regulator n=1 Tax=Agromyces sp. Root81 TaxID=1736601 RepID=UPI0006F9DE32|nr:LacI family DNA-binding transcriptional regulator [Agromyces sp. Root81]KRC58557.1 hypothetical protein ASE14_18475 [Agromyces sp. Root81]
MVSISDVARLAGVSPTTVSHALSGKRAVSDEVREKVHRAMNEIGYVPTRSAQNLALGSTRILALVVPDIGIEYFAELAKSVEHAAMERGYNLMLATTTFESEREARYIEMIKSRAVDGIVYAAGALLEDHERDALGSGLPLVLVDEEVAGVDLPTFVSDNEEGGRLAAEHLAMLGHRRALFFGADHSPVTGLRRSAGFVKSWSAVDGTTVHDLTGDFTEPSGRAMVARHAHRFTSGEITAVFAYNDLMAIGVMNGLRALGLSVPDDVSVIGFDDSYAGTYCWPTLTTLRQDVVGMGSMAVNTLIDSLESKERLTPTSTFLPVGLVVRESTGKVPTP